jgi:hypothetical protein
MDRRIRLALGLLVAVTLACNALVPRAPTPSPFPTLAPSPTPNPPTAIPTVAPTETAAPAPISHSDLYIDSGDVLIHPDPALYAGDKVSFEIFAHDGADLGLSSFPVALYLGEPIPENRIAVETAYPYGLGERLQATFEWEWTATVGQHTLTAVLDPDSQLRVGDEDKSNNSLSFVVTVLPRSALSAVEREAEWVTATSECCIFHYITGSPAERDIELIKSTADAALSYVEQGLGRKMPAKMEFNLINRLLGHGGFTSETVTITYIDRDYAGGGLENVFRHEATHILNRQFGSNRPSLIEEGTATYIAGGHFKLEPFEPRMVGLLALGNYIPLQQLADNFYESQHETGYLEGAAFIDYLVKTYGWDKFTTLMGAFQRADTQSATLDGALRLVYEKTLAEIEQEWLTYLRAQPVDERWRDDVALTVAYYDTVRRYQQADDPSAYFLTAWIPDIEHAVQNDIVADYNRHPDQPSNIALETMLVEVDRALEAADFETVRSTLAAVNAVLDAQGDFAASALATTYLNITRATLEAGYEPRQIRLGGQDATVTASRLETPAALIDLNLVNVNGLWEMN